MAAIVGLDPASETVPPDAIAVMRGAIARRPARLADRVAEGIRGRLPELLAA